MKRICVYCGSKPGNDPVFTHGAEKLGQTMVERKTDLVYGGASIGLMGTIADTVLRGGGEVIGVIPTPLFNDEVTHTRLTQQINVENMHQRKEKMASLSDGFIAMPGGFGTLEEVFEAITWSQLRIHIKPIGLLNISGYYDALHDFIKSGAKQGFIKPEHLSLYSIDDDPERLIDKMSKMVRI